MKLFECLVGGAHTHSDAQTSERANNGRLMVWLMQNRTGDENVHARSIRNDRQTDKKFGRRVQCSAVSSSRRESGSENSTRFPKSENVYNN